MSIVCNSEWCTVSANECEIGKYKFLMQKATGSYHTYLSLVKLQPRFMSCSGRPAFGQNCNLGSCVYSEKSVLGQNTHDDIYDHQSVLPKGRSLTASAGT